MLQHPLHPQEMMGRWGAGVQARLEAVTRCLGSTAGTVCSPDTESRAPLLWRVSPLYLCLVIHL